MHANDKKALKIAIVPVLFWATVSTIFKLGLQVYSPAQLIFLATITSFFVFIVWGMLHKPHKIFERPSRKLLIHAAISGFVSPFLYYLILFQAYSLLPAQLAQPLNMVWPMVLTLLSIPILKQKIGIRSFFALFISFLGIVILSAKGNFTSFADTNFKGVGLALFSSIMWSLYWLYNRKSKFDAAQLLSYSFGFAAVFQCIYLLATHQFHFEWNLNLRYAVYIGLFEVGISFILWGKAMELTSNNARIANLIYLAPFIALIFIRIFLGETIFYTTYIGLIFIVSGIFIQQTDRKQKGE